MKKVNYLLMGAIALLVTIAGGTIGATLSRYQSEATTTPQLDVAKWYVKVGGEDISDGEQKQFNAIIDWEENENISKDEENLIAPGSKGTISFEIEADQTQVPIDYTVKINTEEIKEHSQIKITDVTATPNNESDSKLNNIEDYTYTGGIDLDDISKPIKITINLEWTALGSESDDTALGAESPILSLPITFTASQRIAA